MNIKQCESFVKLADTGSFSKASQDLFISKQGLSRAIHNLEDELGTRLFHPTVRGTELTAAGEAILPEINAILREYQQIKAKLKAETKKELKILFSFGFFSCVSPGIIFDYLERNQDIQLQYACCSDSEIEKRLVNGDYDLAFCSNPGQKDHLNYTHLFQNYRCFIVHRELPLAQKKFISVSDLKGLRIAISAPEEYNDYEYLRQKFDLAGEVLDVFPCYESSTLLQYAEEKRGPTFTVTNLTQVTPSHNTCYVFFDDYQAMTYNMNIITVKGRKLPPHAQSFIRHTQEFCQNALKSRPDFPTDSQHMISEQSSEPES